jgi:lipopolysaccharide export system permease protein
MSVLIATLMAFGKLSSDNEIVIMRTSGVSLYRMMLPVFIVAIGITYALLIFNDRILPEANIRLQVLMTDILRMKPTLTIQAGVFTSDEDIPNFRILAKKTYAETSELEDLTIYDLSRPNKNICVTAQHGKASFSPDYSDIIMDLRDGEIHEIDNAGYRSYRRLKFTHHRVSIPASGFGFQRSDATKAHRDDRTMTSGMMREIVDSISVLKQRKVALYERRMSDEFRSVLAGALPVYPPLTNRQRDSIRSLRPIAQDTAAAAMRALTRFRQLQTMAQSERAAIEFDGKQMDKYLVEIYKKYSIPVACMVFVFIGIPLGMMSRRGGFGIGAGLSLSFFLFYWICLIGGEKLADRDVLSPFMGMWIANIILGVCGVLLTIKTARETTVIDWSVFSRFMPKSFRAEESVHHHNPFES